MAEKEALVEGLGVGGEAGETDEELVVDFWNPLEIGGNGLELNPESPIARDGEAVLPHHSH